MESDFYRQIYHLILSAALAFCSWCYNFVIIFLSLYHPCPWSLNWKYGEGTHSSFPLAVSPYPHWALLVLTVCILIQSAPLSFLQPLPESSLCPNLSPSCHLPRTLPPPAATHTHFPRSIREFSINHNLPVLKISSWLPQANRITPSRQPSII